MASQESAVRTYTIVFTSLMVLLILSIWTGTLDLGAWALFVALAISAAKTLLVVTFFMHLLHSTALIRLMAVGSLMWLAFLLVLTFSDYQTRDWQPDPKPVITRGQTFRPAN